MYVEYVFNHFNETCQTKCRFPNITAHFLMHVHTVFVEYIYHKHIVFIYIQYLCRNSGQLLLKKTFISTTVLYNSLNFGLDWRLCVFMGISRRMPVLI